MTYLTEEELARLIAIVPSAPVSWVQAAVELPRARGAIDELVHQALADRVRRDAVLADLEAALRRAGLEPRPRLLADLRARLGASAG
jgi:hypothetical protein